MYFPNHSKVIWVKKKSLLLRCETLALFVKNLIVDDNYLLHKRKSFPQSI